MINLFKRKRNLDNIEEVLLKNQLTTLLSILFSEELSEKGAEFFAKNTALSLMTTENVPTFFEDMFQKVANQDITHITEKYNEDNFDLHELFKDLYVYKYNLNNSKMIALSKKQYKELGKNESVKVDNLEILLM